MFDHSDFFKGIEKNALNQFIPELKTALKARESVRTFGDLDDWLTALNALPDWPVTEVSLDTQAITLNTDKPLTHEEITELRDTLMSLHPWRKGPFSLFGVDIETEWRSDWKWNRIAPNISSLEGKTVLDVGCGSGYHAWRMRGLGAQLVLGIEPMPKYICQYKVLKHYLPEEPVFVLPLCAEDMPKNMQCFDTVFSMGVLYHRKSPIGHLEELKALLKPGGELVLETLVIEGDEQQVLVPEGRYAKMRNVWFIPSVSQLTLWLKKLGFKQIECIDINQTSLEEQRTTDWMTFQSLVDFLAPENPDLTIEGYPAPLRATLKAVR